MYLFQPFVDSDHVAHQYFLQREYSVILPGIAALILLLSVGEFWNAAFIGWVLIQCFGPFPVPCL